LRLLESSPSALSRYSYKFCDNVIRDFACCSINHILINDNSSFDMNAVPRKRALLRRNKREDQETIFEKFLDNFLMRIRIFCDSSFERSSRSDRAFDVNSPRKINARDCGWHVEMRAFVLQSWRSRSGNLVLRDWGTAEVSRSPRWCVNESKDFANESGEWIVLPTRLTRWCSGHRWPAYDCTVIGNSLEIHFFPVQLTLEQQNIISCLIDYL